MTVTRNVWPWLVLLVLLPLCWLWPSVFGGNTFVPFDPAAFPPASLCLDDEALAAARRNANYDVTEVWPWLLPEMELAQDEVAQGRWPSWNPHARTGAPLHEVGVHGVLYPPHWLWLSGGDPKARIVWLCWISLALAGVFTFGLLRQAEVSRPAAAFGAATYQLSGAMMANAYFWTRLPALAWLPAALLATLCLCAGDRLRRGPFAALAICLAMPWYPGFPPYATAGLLLTGLLFVRILLERLGCEGEAVARALLRRFLGAALVGVLLAMPQLLPSFWFYSFAGARSAAPGYEMAAGARFELYGLLGYLLPDAFGHPLHRADVPPGLNPLCYAWGNLADAAGRAAAPTYNFTEYSVSIGATGFVLACFGARPGRAVLRWYLKIAFAIALGLALFVPVLRLCYHLPVIDNVAPMRWLAPASLLLAWLAAIGLDRLQTVDRASLVRVALAALLLAGLARWLTMLPARWHAADPGWPERAIAERFALPAEAVRAHLHQGAAPGLDRYAAAADQLAAAGTHAAFWLLCCGLVLTAFALLRRTRARPFLLALLALLNVTQLGLAGGELLRGQPLAAGTDTAVHEFLRAEAAASAAAGGFTIARGGNGVQLPAQLPPGQLMVPGVRDLHFYSHNDRRSLAPLAAAIGQALGTEAGAEWCRLHASSGYLRSVLPDAVLAHPVLDLYGVRYVLATELLRHAGALVATGLCPRRGEFYVYRRPHALPRAFTVPALQRCADDDAVLAAMAAPDVRFGDVAFVGPDGPTTAGGAAADTPARAVVFTRDEPAAVELEVTAGAAPWLVLTDTFFAGWTATVDGGPVAIERCNHCQRLVRLPTTACRVRFTHAVPLLWPGLALFALALLALLRVWFSSRSPRRVETGG